MIHPFEAQQLNDLFQTAPDRSDLLNRRESTTLELKENFRPGSAPEYGRTMAGFSNRNGGYILFGITNNPHSLVGMTNERFVDFDPRDLTTFLNNTFSPSIDWEHAVHDIDGKKFGLIYVHRAPTKPIVCIKAVNPMRDGDIHYRYQGVTRLIASADLQSIIEDRIEQERRSWRDILKRTARSTPSATYLLDVTNGRATGEHGSFVISEDLLSKVRFIHEGRFEESGEPALNVIGDVEVVSTELLPGSVQKVATDLAEGCDFWGKEIVEKLQPVIGQEIPFGEGTHRTLSGRHISAIQKVHKKSGPGIFYRSGKKGSRPLYGEGFVRWVIDEFEKDDLFIYKAVMAANLVTR